MERDKDTIWRLDTPFYIGAAVVCLIMNFLMVVGGLKMRRLQSYPLALTAAIMSLIPIHGCLCCAMPVGLWALIVLGDSNTRAGFAAAAR